MNENKKIPIRKDRVKELLKRRNMTQIQLAKITGYTKDRINQMLRSGQAIPRAVDMIARVLDVSPEYLTGESNITPADAIKTTENGYYIHSAGYTEQIDNAGCLIPGYSSDETEERFRDLVQAVAGNIQPGKASGGKDLFPSAEAAADLYRNICDEISDYLKKFVLDPAEKKNNP